MFPNLLLSCFFAHSDLLKSGSFPDHSWTPPPRQIYLFPVWPCRNPMGQRDTLKRKFRIPGFHSATGFGSWAVQNALDI